MSQVRIELQVDSRTGEARVAALGDEFRAIGTKGRTGFAKVKSAAQGVTRVLSRVSKITGRIGGLFAGLGRSVMSLKAMAIAGLAGWGLKQVHDDFVATGEAMDGLKMSLDTITKGEGAEWFERLNKWALRMPINTREAIKAFINMRAMGLEPTIEQMTTLVDTAGALGDPEALGGIARALGQIQTKGRVSTEELLQLAERGVPVFEILAEKMNLTKDQMGDIGRQGLDAGKTIEAIIEGMAERFGGQSAKVQNKYHGLMKSLKSYWREFQRLVMDAGVMEHIESGLRNLLARVEQMANDGRLQTWAQRVAEGYVAASKAIADLGAGAWQWVQRAHAVIQTDFMPAVGQLADRIQIWYFMNEKLIKSQLADWIQTAAERARDLLARLSDIVANADFIQWAQDTVAVVRDLTTGARDTIAFVKDLGGWFSELGDKVFDFGVKVQRAFETLDKFAKKGFTGKVKMLFTGEGSTERPLSEKLAEMEGKVSGFASGLSRLQPGLKLDLTGISGGLAAADNLLAGVFSNQVERYINAVQYKATMTASPFAPWQFRAQADSQLAGARAGLQAIAGLIGGGHAAPVPASAAGGRTVSVGELHIHLPEGAPVHNDQDWREITRKYIVPELEAMR